MGGAHDDDDAYLVTVDSACCRALIEEAPPVSGGAPEGAGSSSAEGAGNSAVDPAKTRNSRGQKRKAVTAEEAACGITERSTKAEVRKVARRMKREERSLLA